MLSYREGQLFLEDLGLRDLAARVPTPFFLISEARLRDNYRALERGLAAAGVESRLRYCAKTNNEAAVLGILAGLGSELLASHLAEVELGRACGFPGPRIAFQRPVLRREEVAAVLERGVGLMHASRLSDLDLLEEAGAARREPVRVSLRLRLRRRPLSPLARLAGRIGLDRAEAEAAALRCRRSPWLQLAGLNFYAGTQQASLAAFGRELPAVARLAGRLAALGAPVEEINLGGGLPSPSLRRLTAGRLWRRYRDRERPSDSPQLLEQSARRLAQTYRNAGAAAGLDPPPALALEPGRALVGNAAVLVTRVAARDGRWLVLDASRNFLGESPVLFTRRLLALDEPDGRRRFAHLAGSTLDTLDVIDWHRRLPPLESGDGLVVADAGAYTISRARRYAGLAPAVYLLTAAGELHRARRAESLADLAAAMTLPGPAGPG